MAEYKNGFSALGNVPISPDRRSSDLQTGRAVYVDEADYSANAKYKDKVDTVEYEGYHREAPIVVPEKGSSGGGSGSSDFSTATLTVNGNFTQSDLFIAPVVEKDPNNEDIAFPTIQSGNSTYTVILYKGRSALMYMGSQSRTITVSGNIETVGTGVYIITGDCTITIS